MVVNGYKISSTNLEDVEMELRKVQNTLRKIADKEYHRLLGEESAFLCDCIVINAIQPQGSASIYDLAVEQTERKIQRSGALGTSTSYNLNVFAQVLMASETSYIKVTCANKKLLKAFDRHLENYSLSEQECQDPDNAKNKTWQTIHARYLDYPTLTVNLTVQTSPDPDKLVFPSKAQRCETMARESLMNQFLSQVSTAEQVQPYQLMHYMSTVAEMMARPETNQALDRERMALSQILLDLDDPEVRKVLFQPQGAGKKRDGRDGQG